ncbi:MAG: cytochrome B [Synechococcaceae cyanobacterium]|nr:cytochrome B [Synechococcaceae cyanobacterium]
MPYRPYQPSLLRLLHVPTVLLVVALWLSGLVILAIHDSRLALLPRGFAGVDWIDVHGSLGVPLVLLLTLFAPYALSVGRPLLRRPANLLPLLALLLSVGSGLLMRESEVRSGLTGGPVVALHVGGWVVMALAVLLHVGGVLRRGGWPLAASMFQTAVRTGDHPADWPAQLRRHFRRG